MTAKRAARRSPSGRWLLYLVVGLVVLIAVAAAFTFLAREPETVKVPPPPAILMPTPDPRVVAAEVARLAPELTPAGTEMLVGEMPNTSATGLAEVSWLLASRGFELLPREDQRDLGQLIDEMKASLAPEDQPGMAQYMRDVREGNLGSEDSVRGRRILTDAVNRLAPERRQRLQGLVERSLRAALEVRRSAKSRTPPPTPSLAPPGPFQPMPPNTPPPEPAFAPSPKSSAPTKGEAYWRDRMKDARAKVTRLRKEVADLEKAAGREATAGADPKKRLERLAQTRVELTEAERAITEIEEEARKAGALPGWLRERE